MHISTANTSWIFAMLHAARSPVRPGGLQEAHGLSGQASCTQAPAAAQPKVSVNTPWRFSCWGVLCWLVLCATAIHAAELRRRDAGSRAR